MMVTTLLIAVPTGIKVFSWLATMWEGRIHFTTPMLFALGFVSMFVIGGLSGHLPRLGADRHPRLATRTSSSRTSTTCSSAARCSRSSPGIYYWFPKMTGRMYNERLGKLHFWLTFVGFNADVLPDALHRAAGDAAPRRRLRAALRATSTSSSRSRRSCSAPRRSSSSTT